MVTCSLKAEGTDAGGITPLKAICIWCGGRQLTLVLAFPSFLSSSLCSFKFYLKQRIGFDFKEFYSILQVFSYKIVLLLQGKNMGFIWSCSYISVVRICVFLY